MSEQKVKHECKFEILLREFNKLVEGYPAVNLVKEKLLSLKVIAAKTESALNHRQLDAIIARCDNYLNGVYGNTKTDKQIGFK